MFLYLCLFPDGSQKSVRPMFSCCLQPSVEVENEHELFVSGHVEAESRHLQRWWWAEQAMIDQTDVVPGPSSSYLAMTLYKQVLL